MPRTGLEQKNVLIVPLSLFIRFNKKIASEKFANLFKKFYDEIFSCDEEIKDHEKFRENLLEKILTSQLVADFNLGKKTKQEFISELLDFLKLTNDESTAMEAAWNSLLEFNPTSNEAFEALIKLTHQGKSIYFIGNTNELHAKKILNLFACFPFKPRQLVFLKNLPHSVLAVPLAVNQISDSERDGDSVTPQRDTLFFCLSYVYKTLLEQPQDCLTKLFNPFKPNPGLLIHLKAFLTDRGKTKDDILLINPYKKTNALTKKLALETLSKENFCTDLLKPEETSAHEAATGSRSLERTLRMSARPPTH